MLVEPQRAAKEKARWPPPRRRRGLAVTGRALLVSLIVAEFVSAAPPAAASSPALAHAHVASTGGDSGPENSHLGLGGPGVISLSGRVAL